MRSSAKTGRAKNTRRTQAERKLFTRQKLIETAARCIAEQGLATSTVSVIARAADLTTGALQFHFGSRQALLEAVMYEFGDRLFERLNEPLPPQDRLEDRLSRVLDEMWDIFREPLFIAVTEILLEIRGDKELHQRLLKTIRRISKALDERWSVTFADSRIDPGELAVARHVALAAIRGLAIRMTYWNDPNSWSKERAYLHRMLMAMLQR